MTEGETEGEREMKTKLKEDKEHLSSAVFPVLFPSEYFGNKFNPVLDYKLLDVMWISLKVSARVGITTINTRLKYHMNRVCVCVCLLHIHTKTMGCFITNGVCCVFV